MGSLTPATPRSFHLHQGFDCTRRCPRSRCVKKFFVWRNDICLNDSKCAKKNTHTHTQTKQALFGWNSPPCPLWICVHAASNVYCIPIKCDKHNAFKLSSSPHFFNQLQTWTFLFSVSTRYNYMSFIEAPNELAWRIGHVHRPKRLGWSIVVGLYI